MNEDPSPRSSVYEASAPPVGEPPERLAEVVPHPPPAQPIRGRLLAPLATEVETLERLVRNGPFTADVQGRCAERVRERAFLIDPERLCERTLLFMARRGRGGDPAQWDDEWKRARIDEAIDDLIDEDEELAARGFLPDDPWKGPHAFLIHWFAIEGHLTLDAAVRFNGLPPETRRPFVALLLEGKSIDWCIRSGLGDRPRLHKELSRGLYTLFYEDPGPHTDPHEGGPA